MMMMKVIISWSLSVGFFRVLSGLRKEFDHKGSADHSSRGSQSILQWSSGPSKERQKDERDLVRGIHPERGGTGLIFWIRCDSAGS